MSFEVTTVNRLAARKLLTSCGVRPEMGRTMSLRQLKEHLENFISLGTITSERVLRELQAAQANAPVNAGAPWDAHQDAELRAHYERGMSPATMASIRGRTVGGIYARLVKLGLMKYDTATGRYEAIVKPNASDESQDEPAQDRGDFLSPEQIAALDKEHKAQDAPPVIASPETIANADTLTRVTNDLVSRVGSLEVSSKAHAARIAQLAHDQAALQGAIADTIAQEVKRIQGAWQRFEVATQDRLHKIEGLAHKAFPKLLRAVAARTRHDKGALNIWLYGPAGTGKSTAARKLAEAFKLDFHTNGPVGSQWDIRGFTDAQGKIVETAFRRAWIHGGVYCWDEGDGSAPAALIEANGALATGFASFPDGVFPRHKDCIIIINGNLRPGAAPDATYNGRYKQDTAFVNRFVAIEWGIDEDLERALLGKLDTIGEQWVKFVRKLRAKIVERGIKGIVVSPRQLQYGIALLDAGAELDEVMEQTVKFMFTDDQWKQVAA